MNSEIYDALKDAGASEEKSRLAAASISNDREEIREIKFKLNFLILLIVPMFLAMFGKLFVDLMN